MIDRKSFKKTFGDVLKSRGYRKKGQAWYKRGESVTSVVDLQKFDHANQYFVNIAIAITSLLDDDDEVPPEHKCHIRSRAGTMFPESALDLAQACCLDSAKLSLDEHVSVIQAFLREKLVPYCERLLDIESVAREYREGGFRRAYVRGEAVDILKRMAD